MTGLLRGHPFRATLVACLGLVAVPLAQGAPLTINTQAGAGAMPLFLGGLISPPVETTDPTTTSAVDLLTDGTDTASAEAEATVLGLIRAKASVDSPSALFQLNIASAYATWNVSLTTDGVDPGAPVDLDLAFDFTGTMRVGQTGSDLSTLGASSNVNLIVAVSPSFDDAIAAIESGPGFDPTAAIIFDGGLSLGGLNAVTDPLFTNGDSLLIGVADWLDSPVTDFVVEPGCSAALCTVTIDNSVSLTDIASLGFGSTIDVWAFLTVGANTWTTNDAFADTNIFDTLNVTVGTSADGVSIVEAVAPPVAAGAPATVALLAIGGAGLFGVRRRRGRAA